MLIELGKTAFAKKDFTSNLEHSRIALAAKLQRYGANSPDIVSNILADRPVASGSRADQLPLLVEQTHRNTIDLWLAAVGDLAAYFDTFEEPCLKRTKVFFAEHLI